MNKMLRYRKVFQQENNKINWRLVTAALGTLIISCVGWWWGFKVIVIDILWSILAIDHLINICEELQLRRFSGTKDLIQRIQVLTQVKKLLYGEATRRVSSFLYERNNQVMVPFINVYIDHRCGFKGYIEIELLQEYNDFLNVPDFPTKLTSQLRYLTERYVVTDANLTVNGTSIIFRLNDTQVSSQIKLTEASQLRMNSIVRLDLNHFINWNKEYHAVISGVTGSGKTMLIEYLIANAKNANWDIRILDPKQSDLARIKDTEQIAVADEKDEMLSLLHESVKEMQHAQKQYKEDPAVDLVPHLIVVDELAALKAMLDRKEQQQLSNDLKQIALLGRQAKFHLVIGVQQANANNIPTEIREQMGIKILLGNSTNEERKFLFSECKINVPIESVGQGLISVNSLPVEFFNAPWIEFDLVGYLNR